MQIKLPSFSFCFGIFHKWSTPFDDAASGHLLQKCERCGKFHIMKRECNHQWDEEGEVDGATKLKCIRCGEVQFRTVPKAGCNHVWKEIANGTYARNGTVYSSWHRMQCTKCGEMKEHKFE